MSASGKVMAAGAIGNLLEWYDFAIYGYFAPLIGRTFFPHEDSLVQLLSADAAVEVLQRDRSGVAGHPGPEHRQGVVELQRVVRLLVAVEGQPGALVVAAHGGYLMTTGLTGEPAALAMLSGAAT